VVLMVSNTLGEEPGSPGHGMALHNVRERLRLLHDVAAQCDVWRDERAFPGAHRAAGAMNMAPLRVLIVDDEALARLRLRTLLQDVQQPACAVAGEAADADEALRALQAGGVDVVLLDIRMPGPHAASAGLRLAAALQALPQPPAVIFVTAHAEHAVKAFELQALDYLTKPVRKDRLAAALARVPRAQTSAAEPGNEAPVLVLADRGRLLRLPLAEVLYFKAEQKYVTVRTAEAAMSSTTPCPTWSAAWAKAFCVCTATPWWRCAPSARWNCAPPMKRATAKAGPCAWRRWMSGWRSRGGRSRP
jgi:DNA-binding LytR/AlgR family response regulator